MNDGLLFNSFVHCTPTKSFDISSSELEEWSNKQAPIVDMLVISEDNIDV